jgi:hypothetical protein
MVFSLALCGAGLASEVLRTPPREAPIIQDVPIVKDVTFPGDFPGAQAQIKMILEDSRALNDLLHDASDTANSDNEKRAIQAAANQHERMEAGIKLLLEGSISPSD